jgi:hypothetical protein
VNFGAIVEGHSELKAVPVLLRRVVPYVQPGLVPNVAKPLHRMSRGQMVNESELKRAVELVARRVGEQGRVFILLDADDDRACEIGPRLLRWAQEARADRAAGVVVAVREYESWFLAAAQSLAGQRGLPSEMPAFQTPEAIRGAKEKLDGLMEKGYSEVLDQPAFTALFDLQAARRAPSFDKLVREVARLVGVPAPPLAAG